MAKEKEEMTADLVLKSATDKIIEEGKAALILNSVESEEKLQELVDSYKNIVVANIKDKKGYDFVVEGAKRFQKLRTGLQTYRKELAKPIKAIDSALIAEEKRLIEILKPIEDNLLAQKKIFEDLTQAEKDKAFKERITKLTENGYELTGGLYKCGAVILEANKIQELDDDNFDFYVDLGKKEVERKIAEEKRRADEIAENKALKEQVELLMKQNRELLETINKRGAEVEAQSEALEKAYEAPAEEIVSEIPVSTAPETEHKPAEEIIIPVTKGEGESKATDFLGEPLVKETTETEEEEEYVSPYKQGFEDFRKRLSDKLNNPDKFTRADLIDWCVAQEI